ncbi:hypothetical protein CFBP1573P_06189 [Pseudomonas syringae pv. persicae]|uniref:Uncharacterized protein n=2 Tax=Pseudomonas syringae group genomosp. 3 TaxID=251701 RepID=A0AB38EB02_9PSED|nr:hypothetical protein NCPPB2254_01440 [Pseudomonas syringae pv. persicae]SOQ16633.1 hypothetical protein CFBP1573P_06189 [Pseudomonas syringae pv. persicae]
MTDSDKKPYYEVQAFQPDNIPKDAPINLLRSGGESQFARHPALFAENGLMQRALRAFPPGFPC